MDFLKKLLVFLAVLGGASAARAEGPNDLLIIANKSVSADSAAAGEIKAVFLKAKTSLGGDTVFPLNAKAGSDLRAAFCQRVLKMGEDKERGFWEDEKVKKGTQPPPEVPATLKAVFSKSGGISYVFRKDYKDGTAKILATFAE
jgi:hypothetical protein